MKLLYLHARNALEQVKQKACPNRQCGKAGNTIDPLKEGARKAASL